MSSPAASGGNQPSPSFLYPTQDIEGYGLDCPNDNRPSPLPAEDTTLQRLPEGCHKGGRGGEGPLDRSYDLPEVLPSAARRSSAREITYGLEQPAVNLGAGRERVAATHTATPRAAACRRAWSVNSHSAQKTACRSARHPRARAALHRAVATLSVSPSNARVSPVPGRPASIAIPWRPTSSSTRAYGETSSRGQPPTVRQRPVAGSLTYRAYRPPGSRASAPNGSDGESVMTNAVLLLRTSTVEGLANGFSGCSVVGAADFQI